MGLFNRKKEGGMMDVIRCDEAEYLIWKWHPTGSSGSTLKENAIRWGSSLRVKDGEVAVFVYKQNDGCVQDYIVGPYDDILKTANLPLITSLIGLSYAGQSPFQAEVYFINLAGNISLPFGIPAFDVCDPRFEDFPVKMTVRGTLTINITDYKAFIKLTRLINYDIEKFRVQTRSAVSKYVKNCVANAPADYQIPVLQIERKLLEINDLINPRISQAFAEDFGINLKRLDLAAIEVDKDTKEYCELRSITADLKVAMLQKQNEINMKNLEDTQAINAENMDDTLRIQREETARFQRLQTESQHLTAHQIDQQAAVLKAAAENLGSMGAMNLGGDGNGGGGFNPVGIMTGMAVGGAMGGQMAGMMNAAGQGIQNPAMTPPPPPQVLYNVSVNSQSTGPFNLGQLQEMVRTGQLKKSSFVWTPGMANWEKAGEVGELEQLFDKATPPPLPPSSDSD